MISALYLNSYSNFIIDLVHLFTPILRSAYFEINIWNLLIFRENSLFFLRFFYRFGNVKMYYLSIYKKVHYNIWYLQCISYCDIKYNNRKIQSHFDWDEDFSTFLENTQKKHRFTSLKFCKNKIFNLLIIDFIIPKLNGGKIDYSLWK